MNKLTKYIAYSIVAATVIFNLYLNFPETKILADPNDNIFQYSLVYRTNWVWENYGCPLSLSCLPNLTDHVVTAWAEGYPLPFYYSHIPQILIVASYKLIISPIASIIHNSFSLYEYYNWTKYLLLCLFPIPVFLAMLLVGFAPIPAALSAFFSAHYSTDGWYGIDAPSFLWRGYGLTSQLYAMFFFPLALAYTYRTTREVTENIKTKLPFFTKNSILAAVFLTLTTAGHLGMGVMALLSTLAFIFLDINKTNCIKRFRQLIATYAIVGISLSYWIIPILLNNNYHIISFWDPIWKFNSYGWYEVIRQYWQGEIFDWQRAGIITALSTLGLFIVATNKKLFVFSILFVIWILMYFGTTTWGGLMYLIPGMKEFHQHRFIVAIQIVSLFLLPAAIEFLYDLIKKGVDSSVRKILIILSLIEKLKKLTKQKTTVVAINTKKISEAWMVTSLVTTYVLTIALLTYLVIATATQTVKYATLNNKWIYEANNAYKYDEKNFKDMISYLGNQPYARYYAGRPGNWGREFKLGSSEMYMLLGITGFDVSQFLPETWSPMSENDQNFDERVAVDYDLLNIKYNVAPKNENFTDKAVLDKTFGPFEVYKIPTSGWFDVVASPMLVKTDKTNFINIVHLWHRSYPRTWNMHPLISVENNPTIPAGTKRIISMKNEADYEEDDLNGKGTGQIKNIFSDFPFTFPEATYSGKIANELVYKQVYSAAITVPENCTSCFGMFKMSYHPDWEVTVDGKTAEKFGVFPYFLATPLSPGTHSVEFSYHPNGLKVFLLVVEILLIPIIIFRKRLLNLFKFQSIEK